MSFDRCHRISVEPTMLGPCRFNALLVKRDTWIKRVQKMAKVDLCFSSNKLTKWYLLHFLSWSWPIFCTEKNWMTLVQNIWPKLQQMYKRVEVGLIRGRSFVGWKYRPCREKKLKIAMLNEADFMVKLRFEGWKLCFANICAPVTWVKYLTEFNSSCFPYWVDWEVFILSPTNIKWEGNISEIFGCG